MLNPVQSALVAGYGRLLGFCYHILGDAALAAQASEAICLRVARGPLTEFTLWRTAVQVLECYLQRGLFVQPLTPEGTQASLLRAIHRLEPFDRVLLLLRYHEQLELKLMSEVLQFAQPTLRLALAEARRRLLAAQDDEWKVESGK